jgi:hypothetical protein
MPSEMSSAELRTLLRSELSGRLAQAGWQLIDPEPTPEFTLAEFDCPLGATFSGVAQLGLQVPDTAGPPLVVITVTVGAAYELLRCMWPLLRDSLGPRLRAVCGQRFFFMTSSAISTTMGTYGRKRTRTQRTRKLGSGRSGPR